jgi:hypothetical protein
MESFGLCKVDKFLRVRIVKEKNKYLHLLLASTPSTAFPTIPCTLFLSSNNWHPAASIYTHANAWPHSAPSSYGDYTLTRMLEIKMVTIELSFGNGRRQEGMYGKSNTLACNSGRPCSRLRWKETTEKGIQRPGAAKLNRRHHYTQDKHLKKRRDLAAPRSQVELKAPPHSGQAPENEVRRLS